jgi:hypothetical protein
MAVQLTREQHQKFLGILHAELDKMTMSWDAELKEWYPTAINAVKFASVTALNVSVKQYARLFEFDKMGLNMNDVAVLCNNMEVRTPAEMGVDPKEWARDLELNQRVSERWMILKEPIEKKVFKQFEIMLNKPKLVIAEA